MAPVAIGLLSIIGYQTVMAVVINAAQKKKLRKKRLN
jgi:hypothetical protein